MSSSRVVFSVETESRTDGVTIIKVAGQFINNRGQHTFDRVIDGLAPSWKRTNHDRVHIIDLREVTEIDPKGRSALEYACWRFRFCGAKHSLCVANTEAPFNGWGQLELVQRFRWHTSIESAVIHHNI